MKNFELDMTKSQLPIWWPSWAGMKINVVIGAHGRDLDIDEPQEWQHRMFAHILSVRPNKSNKQKDINMPIGFNIEDLPPGSKLTAL